MSAFRISGKAGNTLSAVERLEVDARPQEVRLIDGRTLSVTCDPDGLTRATVFMTEDGAYLRAEERVYCIIPGIGGETYPGMTPGYTVEDKMDVTREGNISAAPDHIALRRIVSGAVARMDLNERVRAITTNHPRQERLAALLADATPEELIEIQEIIGAALSRSTAAIAAE